MAENSIVSAADAPVGGTPFRFDAEEFLKRREAGKKLSFTPVPKSDLLTQSEEVVGSLLRGEVPLDVAEQIRINTAETSIQGGVSGQIGRNLVARDLGVSSLQLREAGVQLAGSLVELNQRRETVNREFELKFEGFNESVRLAEDQFALELNKANQSATGSKLAALQLQSNNRIARLKLQNELIINNSKTEIAGAQSNMESISEGFLQLNRQIQNIVDFGE